MSPGFSRPCRNTAACSPKCSWRRSFSNCLPLRRHCFFRSSRTRCSGKSTLTKLVQRLYVPERGRVLVDGMDLAMADPAWLRRQIGVVLQENTLFNRSVRDNIALADPAMPMERVIAAARLAGAHEFILELPEGYDTIVGERGSTLSGGQRQRI